MPHLRWRKTESFVVKGRVVIAVVDDDPSMLRAMETLLDAHGFGVLLFASGEEFLKRDPALHIDCVLLDIHLGGMSGIDLHQRLKALGSSLPAIFMTALDDEGLRSQAIRAGGVACLKKPFPAQQLIGAIAKSVP